MSHLTTSQTIKSLTLTLKLTGPTKLTRNSPEWEDNTPAEETTARYTLTNANDYWLAQSYDYRHPEFGTSPVSWSAGRKPKHDQCFLPSGYFEWVKEQ